MPIYTNHHNASNGNEYLKVPPNTPEYKSIFFYDNVPNLTMSDTEPFYNPVLFTQLLNFVGGESYDIELPQHVIGQNSFLFLQSNTNSTSLNDIEILFNSSNNLPSLPLSNGIFNINNNHRIKRLHVDIAIGCIGQLLIMVTDKFVQSNATMNYDYKP